MSDRTAWHGASGGFGSRIAQWLRPARRDRLIAAYRTGGLEAVRHQLRPAGARSGGGSAARRVLSLGAYLDLRGVTERLRLRLLLRRLASSDHSPASIEAAVSAAVATVHNSGGPEAQYRLISAFERRIGAEPKGIEAKLLNRLRTSPAYQLSVLTHLPQAEALAFEPVKSRLCYVLHHSLPYSSDGYATRSHSMCMALAKLDYDVIALSRPGFPVDADPGLGGEVSPADIIDGVNYVRSFEPRRGKSPLSNYLLASAGALESRFLEYRPELVVASSDYVAAMPALIAARRVGVPFAYEVRGLWEITRVSREPQFETTSQFRVQRLLETVVAGEADQVFTINEALRQELIRRGVSKPDIALLPNACDPARFTPAARDPELAARLGVPDGVPVIGYVGTFSDYEGLDDLAMACGHLSQRGIEFRLLLVGGDHGSGPGRGRVGEQIADIAGKGGFADWLIMPGRVAHDEVEGYYSLIDIVAFPRKPWPICEMVSPLKPLEALAMEKAVVVSSVQALSEIIRDGSTGCVFAKGDIDSLTRTLALLVGDPDTRLRLGKAGRAWVLQERTWQQTAARAAEAMAMMTARAPSARRTCR